MNIRVTLDIEAESRDEVNVAFDQAEKIGTFSINDRQASYQFNSKNVQFGREISITKAQLRALWSEFLVIGEIGSESELIVIHELEEEEDHDRGELDLHEGDIYASTRGGDKGVVARLDGARVRLPLAEGRGK